MSYSTTQTDSTTFTISHAKHIASKVATDLKRLQRFYGFPDEKKRLEFELEITVLLKAGYLSTVTYGFMRGGSWIEPTIKYTAQDLAADLYSDDDPGKIRPGADISGAVFYSYLTYNSKWRDLIRSEKEQFEKHLPFVRSGATEPEINGYLSTDLNYTAGGRALSRSQVKSI